MVIRERVTSTNPHIHKSRIRGTSVSRTVASIALIAGTVAYANTQVQASGRFVPFHNEPIINGRVTSIKARVEEKTPQPTIPPPIQSSTIQPIIPPPIQSSTIQPTTQNPILVSQQQSPTQKVEPIHAPDKTIPQPSQLPKPDSPQSDSSDSVIRKHSPHATLSQIRSFLVKDWTTTHNIEELALSLYVRGIEYDIDPAFALAVATQETGHGRFVNGINNFFGIHHRGDRTPLRNFKSVDEGVAFFYDKIATAYIPIGQTTPSTIACSENSPFAPHGYVGFGPLRDVWVKNIPRFRTQVYQQPSLGQPDSVLPPLYYTGSGQRIESIAGASAQLLERLQSYLARIEHRTGKQITAVTHLGARADRQKRNGFSRSQHTNGHAFDLEKIYFHDGTMISAEHTHPDSIIAQMMAKEAEPYFSTLIFGDSNHKDHWHLGNDVSDYGQMIAKIEN